MRKIAITGHRVLSLDTRRLVHRDLQSALARETGPVVGLTCLAEGSDQIFADLVLEAGGAIEAFIAAERFAESMPAAAQRGYRRLRALAGAVHTVRRRHPTPESYMEAGRMMVDRADALWAVWDGEVARGHGGTADVVAYAQERSVPVDIIWPTGAINESAVGDQCRTAALDLAQEILAPAS